MQRNIILLLTLLILPLAGENVFTRIVKGKDHTDLQTGITNYEKSGISVSLIGAVHIADKAYYEKLNREFRNYDSLLFELVGGDVLKGAQPPKEEDAIPADGDLGLIKTSFEGFARDLALTKQNEEIDFTAANFVHADMSHAQFEAAMEANKERIFEAAFAMALQSKMPDMASFLEARLRQDANGQKRSLASLLGSAGNAGGLLGDSVLIGERNAVAFEVLKNEIAAGKRKIGIFYGAAHLQDMHARLTAMGFQPKGHRWLTAWHMPGPPLPDETGKSE